MIKKNLILGEYNTVLSLHSRPNTQRETRGERGEGRGERREGKGREERGEGERRGERGRGVCEKIFVV